MKKTTLFKILILLAYFNITLFAQKINIAVAANVSYVIDKLIKDFNKTNPSIDVVVTLGSSGKLTAQIKNAAPYDLFMSANMKYPNTLYEDKLAITKPYVYAQGALVLLSKRKRDFSKGIMITKEPNIKKISIANPKTAPYGKATVEAIKNIKIYNDIRKKFVFGESISQTVSFTITAADIGFIAKSTLYGPRMKNFKENINWINIDSKLYTPIKQGIVILKRAFDNKEAKIFYEYMLSSNAKKILKEYGYIVNE